MLCFNCGKPIEDNASFCTNCGAQVPKGQALNAPYPNAQSPNTPHINGESIQENTQYIQPNEPQYEAYNDQYANLPYNNQAFVPGYPGAPQPAPKKKSNALIITLICIVVILFAGLTVVGLMLYSELSDRGDGNNHGYAAESEASDEDDDDNEADSEADKKDKKDDKETSKKEAVDYSKALDDVELLLSAGSYEDACSLLEDMDIDEAHKDYESYSSMMLAASVAPQIASVDSNAYPAMTIKLSHENFEGFTPTKENITVLENNTEIADYEFSTDADGSTLISYRTNAAGSGKSVTVDVNFTFGSVSVPLASTYTVPVLSQANVEFVNADVSEYPTVKLYLRVTDSMTGESIENMLANSFVVEERLEGGEYLAREVSDAFSLEGNDGLNTALVADKSDSISDSDMVMIKTVMTEFVNSMDFNSGDQAMVIAFDSIAQTMCTFTNDPIRLSHGIENMSTDGMTACYDAIYNAVQNASLKGGARCVIAFTDGIDNESLHTSQEVINYANTMQVPLYIIGVGDQLDSYILDNMAYSTGGRYWDINDLYDLEQIFNAIYVEQKDLYVVHYESEANASPDALRDIVVQCNGGGYTGNLSTSFTPIITADTTHESRYEIFAADVSWEEANELCTQKGGHLATITDATEEATLIAMAEAEGLDYIWLGGYTSYDNYSNVFAHWITGEQFSYQKWATGEPSRMDLDGTLEWYLMLWNVESLGGWTWNDQRNDPVSDVSYMSGKIGYICEYE